MKKSKYEVFMKVVEYGSLSKAAESCNYSQPAVSQIISSLEQELGMPLLNRSHSGVSFTSEGEQVLPYIRNLAEDAIALNEKISEMHGLETGLIKIAAPSSLSREVITPLLQMYKVKHPTIRFEFYTGTNEDIERWLEIGRVEIAFLDLPVRGQLRVIPLFKDRMVGVFPEDESLPDKKVIPIKYFDKKSFILLRNNLKPKILNQFELRHVNPEIMYSASDGYAILSMVESGLGSTILPGMMVRGNGRHVQVRDITPAFAREIGVAVKERRRNSTCLLHFLDFLKETIPDLVHHVEKVNRES